MIRIFKFLSRMLTYENKLGIYIIIALARITYAELRDHYEMAIVESINHVSDPDWRQLGSLMAGDPASAGLSYQLHC
jgi:hypothetical protein